MLSNENIENKENINIYKCALFGCIGNDDNGFKFYSSLNDLKIKALLEINIKYPTSRCGVGINNKERCLLPEVGASCFLSLDYAVSKKVN